MGDCEKVRYRSEKAANKAVKSIRRSRKDGFGDLHAYWCSRCKSFHVGHTDIDFAKQKKSTRL